MATSTGAVASVSQQDYQRRCCIYLQLDRLTGVKIPDLTSPSAHVVERAFQDALGDIKNLPGFVLTRRIAKCIFSEISGISKTWTVNKSIKFYQACLDYIKLKPPYSSLFDKVNSESNDEELDAFVKGLFWQFFQQVCTSFREKLDVIREKLPSPFVQLFDLFEELRQERVSLPDLMAQSASALQQIETLEKEKFFQETGNRVDSIQEIYAFEIEKEITDFANGYLSQTTPFKTDLFLSALCRQSFFPSLLYSDNTRY